MDCAYQSRKFHPITVDVLRYQLNVRQEQPFIVKTRSTAKSKARKCVDTAVEQCSQLLLIQPQLGSVFREGRCHEEGIGL